MTESAPLQANVRVIKQWSPIWVVPIAAVLIGLWMLFSHFQNQGVMLLLVAEDAEGIVAGKTQIKNRSVDVGQVVSVELSEDLTEVLIQARMKPNMTPLLNAGSQFWVVKPQIGRGGVTGLDTLLSGVYIELQPGDKGETQLSHPLLNSPPVAPADAPGVRVELNSADTTGLAVGDPVLYRGYEVGTVELSDFSVADRRTRFQLYIREPYDELVTDNVRFWLSSGLAFDFSAEGLSVDIGSATTLLTGGVSFDLMDGWPAGEQVADGTEFQLFPDKQSIQEGLYSQYIEYLVFFDESVRGLKAGAPVEYRGVRVGTVATVPFFFAIEKPFEVSVQQGVPVLIRIESARLYEKLNLSQLDTELQQAIDDGLHAVLKTSNLITGALYIDLDINSSWREDSDLQQLFNEQRQVSATVGYPTLPSARSGFSNMEQKLLMALDKINNLPVESMLAQGEQTLAATNEVMQNAQQLVQSMQTLLDQPQLQQLPADIQLSLQQLRTTLQGLSPDGAAYSGINDNLQALEQVLRELQPVIKTLNQQSNSLIFNASDQPEPEPRKARL
ncbi:intermembrane transport protein PqiB [Arsukibacterium indicum]|uniref:Intermembrane transport protein PqiB n=1 Tax=Arsukibacterium indicum TaxID=2848612 RepID=A0ABS6MHP1_9GAMM|nr:intermembrane transport protein PqiB [Arsukibacterium indicum]MBV2128290.1 intermembrane transport protein PqiB [Arsukibacterium indicum]